MAGNREVFKVPRNGFRQIINMSIGQSFIYTSLFALFVYVLYTIPSTEKAHGVVFVITVAGLSAVLALSTMNFCAFIYQSIFRND